MEFGIAIPSSACEGSRGRGSLGDLLRFAASVPGFTEGDPRQQGGTFGRS